MGFREGRTGGKESAELRRRRAGPALRLLNRGNILLGIFILISSFILGLLGIIHSHAAKPGKTSIFGMTHMGLAMVIIANIGFIGGIVKEIQSISEAKESTRLLKELHAKVIGEAEESKNPEISKVLRVVGDRINYISTRSRESNFSMSDFARSNFRGGDFAQSNFENSLFDKANFDRATFRGATFKGADLSNIIIDKETKLPSK
jgi:hypothetical protein